MSEVVGDLKINLTLEGQNFTLTVAQARRALAQLENQIDTTGSGINRLERHLTSFTTRFRHFVITMGAVRFMLMDIQDVFLSLPGSILKTSGEIERMTKLMEGLSKATGDTARKQEAIDNTKFVFAIAQKAPFDVKSIQDTFVKLKTAGIDPTNGSLQALIDSVARFGGTSENLKRASIAIQQMAGKGVISMEELRQQLGESVPNAIQLLARGMKLSMAEMVKLISKGQVEANDALKRLFAQMRLENEGAAADMMKTWTGMTELLKTRWTLFQKEIGDSGFMDEAKRGLQSLIDILNDPSIKQFGVNLGKGLAEATKGIAELTRWLIVNLDTVKNIALGLALAFGSSRVLAAVASLKTAVQGYFYEAFAQTKKLQEAQARVRAVEIAAEAQRLRDKIATDEQMLARNQAQYNSMLNQAQAYHVELAALETKYRINAAGRTVDATTGRFVSAAQYAADVQRIATLKKIAEQEAALRTEQFASAAAMRASIETTRAAAAEKDKAAAAALKLGQGITFATVAATAGRFIWTLLGGWIGLISTALTIGIPLWLEYGNAVKKARKEIEAALKSGFVSDENVQQAKKALDDSKSELDAAERNYAFIKETRKGSIIEQYELKQASQRIIQARAQVAKDEDAYNQARLLNTRQHGEQMARQLEQNADEEANVLRKADREAGTRFEDRRRKAMEEIKDKTKLAAEIKKIDTEQLQEQIQTQTKLREMYESQRAAAKEALRTRDPGLKDTPERKAAELFIEELDKKIADNAKFTAELQRQLTTDPVLIASDKKTNDPFERFLAQKAKSLANIRAQINTITTDVLDDAKLMGIAQQKFAEMVEGGMFKDRKLTSAEYKKGVDLVFAELQAEQVRESVKKIEAELDKGTVELKHARDRFYGSDLETFNVDKEQLVTDKLVAKIKVSMDQIAPLLKGGYAQVQKFMSDLNLIAVGKDTFAFLDKLKKDNQKGRLDLMDDEVAKARITAMQEVRIVQESTRIQLDDLNKRLGEDISKREQFNEMKVAIEAEAAERIRQINAKLALDTRTPFEKLMVDWANDTKALGDSLANWATGFIDMFVDGIRKGKIEWGSFVEQILADILKIQARKAFTQAGGQLFDLAGDAFIKMFGMANGGIMTSAGSLPLKMYSKGGIANSPQVTVFGEGRMPEAYVPLPDGRAIPVRMQGNMGGGNVQVNVINNTPTQVTAKQNGPRFDGKRMVLDVVLEAASTPGPFRDQLRQVVR